MHDPLKYFIAEGFVGMFYSIDIDGQYKWAVQTVSNDTKVSYNAGQGSLTVNGVDYMTTAGFIRTYGTRTLDVTETTKAVKKFVDEYSVTNQVFAGILAECI